MAYEIFERKTPRLGSPVMSFSKIGSITFNQTAARVLEKAKIKNILLLWDKDAKKLAMKVSTQPNDIRAYTIRYNEKGNGASFSAKTFFDHVGIKYDQRKQISIELQPDSEIFLEVPIPESLMAA